MQAASQAYKEIMRQGFRNPLSYIRVTIGLINQEAQASAFVPQSNIYTYYSDLKRPLDNYLVEELYATCDQDYTTVDGSMYFLPRQRADIVLNQGIVSEDLLGSIEVHFPIQYDIKGLTIEFGKAYPVDFTIGSDNNTVKITGNHASHFVTEEIFEGASYLRFTPTKMVNDQSRFRINQLTMGIGIYFDNHNILSATKEEHISPIMEELPTIDFNLVVDNKNRAFDIENDESTVNFLEIGQQIEVLYGQELDDGSIEWLPGAKVQLREWSADDQEMSFTATDRFDGMDGTYYKGLYRPEGISLYDLAVDVFNDAGVDSRTYWIDNYLKDVKVCNPMPVITYKEALQLIANAGRCILYQDRSGNIFLKSSFVPDMEASSDNETYYSHAGAVLDKTAKQAYAMTVHDYADVVQTQYFLPRSNSGSAYLNTGYISEQVADVNGIFKVNPTLEISLEARYKCFGLTLEFGRNNPVEMIFHAYLSGELQEDYMVSGLTATAVISHEFPEFDQLVLEFTKGTSNNRVVLDNVTFGDSTDYELSYGSQLNKTPKGTQLPKVRELQVVRTLYNEGLEVKELTKETINVTALDNRYIFYFSNPSYNLSSSIQSIEAANQVRNGDFNLGMLDWKCNTDLCTLSDSSEGNGDYHSSKLTFISLVTSREGIYQEFQNKSGHSYYVQYWCKCSNAVGYDIGIIFSPEGSWYSLFETYQQADTNWSMCSAIYKNTDYNNLRLRLIYRNQNGSTYGDYCLFDQVLLVDLTEIYGAGNEPSKEWCDQNLSFWDGIGLAPSYGEKKDNIRIVDSSSYFATVELKDIIGACQVSITGTEYVVSQSKLSRQLNPTGSLEGWENPLVSDTIHAVDMVDWIGDYLKSDREYDLQYRGEPRIDANDIAFLENKYVPDLLLRIYEHTLKFNGAFSGSIKARREMSNVATAKNRLVRK